MRKASRAIYSAMVFAALQRRYKHLASICLPPSRLPVVLSFAVLPPMARCFAPAIGQTAYAVSWLALVRRGRVQVLLCNIRPMFNPQCKVMYAASRSMVISMKSSRWPIDFCSPLLETTCWRFKANPVTFNCLSGFFTQQMMFVR